MTPRVRLAALARWIALGVVVGVLCGGASAVFLWLLDRATRLRTGHEALVYALPLAKGRRVRVTLAAKGSRLAAFAYDGKGRIAPELMTDAQFERRIRGLTKRTTPGANAFTFTARTTGRHFIQVVAGAGGTAGEYTLRVERLNLSLIHISEPTRPY